MGLPTKTVSKEKVMSEEEKAYFKRFINFLSETLHDARNKEELIDILSHCITRVQRNIKHDKSL